MAVARGIADSDSATAVLLLLAPIDSRSRGVDAAASTADAADAAGVEPVPAAPSSFDERVQASVPNPVPCVRPEGCERVTVSMDRVPVSQPPRGVSSAARIR